MALLQLRVVQVRDHHCGQRGLAMPKQQPNGTPGKKAVIAKALGIGRASVYRVL